MNGTSACSHEERTSVHARGSVEAGLSLVTPSDEDTAGGNLHLSPMTLSRGPREDGWDVSYCRSQGQHLQHGCEDRVWWCMGQAGCKKVQHALPSFCRGCLQLLECRDHGGAAPLNAELWLSPLTPGERESHSPLPGFFLGGCQARQHYWGSEELLTVEIQYVDKIKKHLLRTNCSTVAFGNILEVVFADFLFHLAFIIGLSRDMTNTSNLGWLCVACIDQFGRKLIYLQWCVFPLRDLLHLSLCLCASCFINVMYGYIHCECCRVTWITCP